MSYRQPLKIITLALVLVLGFFCAHNLFAAGSVFTHTESFDSTTNEDTANTSADWDTTIGQVQLPFNSSGNTKQFNGSVVTLGNYVYYAWVDFRYGIGPQKGHIYLQRYDKNGANPLASDVKVDNVATTDMFIGDDYATPHPKMLTDGTYIYVYWVKDYNLYLQKFDSSGNRLWNSGDLQVNGKDASNNNIYVYDYTYGHIGAVVSADKTRLIFFWDSGSGLYMQKVDPSNFTNGRDGNSLRLLNAYLDIPSASSDGSDNYYVTYSSYDYTNWHKVVCLDKFNSAGTKLWSKQVASASSIYSTDVATDTSGNSYVVWDDPRNDAIGHDVFLRKFDTNGNALWSGDVQVNSDTGYAIQQNAKAKLDASSAPVVIWEDQRTTGKTDIYAQRFDTNGSAQWSSETKVNQGDNPTAYANYYTGFDSGLTLDSSDTIYIAWFSYRATADYDIFGNKVTSGGTALGTDWTITTTESGGGFISPATAQSKTVDQTSSNIYYGKVYGSYDKNGQTINFYLSNDGGAHWQQTDMLGSTCTFTTSGSDLRWKAEFSSTDVNVAPVIYNILIEYIIQGNADAFHKELIIFDDKWHYLPTGWMAEKNHVTAMTMDSSSAEDPVQGTTCVKITYNPAEANWAGFYVQASGKWRANGGTGIDISKYSALVLKARAGANNNTAIQVQFGVGGDTGDTCNVKTNWQCLSTEWRTYFIDLTGKNLSDVNGLVLVNMRRQQPIDPVIYLDDIKFIGPGPAVINDLTPSLGASSGMINLAWTAPAGDYTNTSYILKYATDYFSDETGFNSATTYSQSWTPAAPGTPESHVLGGLTPGQGYYIAIETRDEQGNQSAISNVIYYHARSAGLGIRVDGTAIDLGEILAGTSKSGGPIAITNIGGIPMTVSLSLNNPVGWLADVSNATMNHFVLMGAFATTVTNVSWNAGNHAILTTPAVSTDIKFAGDRTGANFAVDETRKLYIRFTAPVSISPGTDYQKIYINIDAGTGN